MIRASRIALAASVMSMLQTLACNPYACVYETRFVLTNGSVQSANGNVTVEFVSYRQYRPDQQIPNTVGYHMQGDGFPAAPEALTLTDARNGATIAPLHMNTSATSFVAGSAWEVRAARSEAVFQLLLSGSARLVVQLANDASVDINSPKVSSAEV